MPMREEEEETTRGDCRWERGSNTLLQIIAPSRTSIKTGHWNVRTATLVPSQVAAKVCAFTRSTRLVDRCFIVALRPFADVSYSGKLGYNKPILGRHQKVSRIYGGQRNTGRSRVCHPSNDPGMMRIAGVLQVFWREHGG